MTRIFKRKIVISDKIYEFHMNEEYAYHLFVRVVCRNLC